MSAAYSDIGGEYASLESFFKKLVEVGKLTEAEGKEQLDALSSAYYTIQAQRVAETTLSFGVSEWVGDTWGQKFVDYFRENRPKVDLPEVESDILRQLGVNVEAAQKEDEKGYIPAAKEQAKEAAASAEEAVVTFPWKETLVGAGLGLAAALAAPIVAPGAASVAIAAVPEIAAGAGAGLGFLFGKAKDKILEKMGM